MRSTEQLNAGPRAHYSTTRLGFMKSSDGARGARGRLMRRSLILADVVGFSAAFLMTTWAFGSVWYPGIDALDRIAVYVVAILVFVLGAKLFGLYDRDEERPGNTTADDLIRLLILAMAATFVMSQGTGLVRGSAANVIEPSVFCALLAVNVAFARVVARTLARRAPKYLQRVVIVGAGDVGQLMARKLLHHPDYGVEVVGFVDTQPKERRGDLGDLTILGSTADLQEIVRRHRVDRVIVAFSQESDESLVERIRMLRTAGVHVDIVPRLFDLIDPNATHHTIEGARLVTLTPMRLPRGSRVLKRVMDIVMAATILVLSAPLLLAAAAALKLDSPGPVLFRQRRLGKDRRPFMLLKLRTMRVDTDEDDHRAYVAAMMTSPARSGANGLHKLEPRTVTRVGRWLRRSSLDEFPQLLNVLKGDMSIVGPRPCIPYEVEHFAPHHFDRFLVPAGMTGLWQVSGRSHSTFGEALDLDVLYAHGWSMGLDVSLILRTPLQLVRGATA